MPLLAAAGPIVSSHGVGRYLALPDSQFAVSYCKAYKRCLDMLGVQFAKGCCKAP